MKDALYSHKRHILLRSVCAARTICNMYSGLGLLWSPHFFRPGVLVEIFPLTSRSGSNLQSHALSVGLEVSVRLSKKTTKKCVCWAWILRVKSLLYSDEWFRVFRLSRQNRLTPFIAHEYCPKKYIETSCLTSPNEKSACLVSSYSWE